MAQAALVGTSLALWLSTPAQAQRFFPAPSDGLHGTVEVGQRTLGGSGNLNRYRKYITPPQDLSLALLRLGMWRGGFEHIALALEEPTERDNRSAALLSNPFPYFRLVWGREAASFFLDPRAEESDRREVETSAGFSSPGGRLWLAASRPLRRVTYSKEDVSGGQRVFYPLAFSSRDTEGQAVYAMGHGSVGLTYANQQMEETSRLPARSGQGLVVQPRDVSSQDWRADYSLYTPAIGSLTAVYWNNTADQHQAGGVLESTRRSLNQWAAEWSASPGSFDVGASLGAMSASQPNTLSGWARRSRSFSLFTGYRPLRGLDLRAGYGRKRVDWVRPRVAAQDALTADKPAWNTIWFDGRYRPRLPVSVRVRLQEQRLGALPERAELTSGAARPSAWFDRVSRAEASVESSPLSRLSLYATLLRDRRRGERRWDTTTRRLALGGWYQVSPVVGLSASYSKDSIASTSAALPLYFAIRNRAFDMAINAQPHPDWGVDLGWGYTRTTGTESLRQRLATLALNYRLTMRQRLILELQRELFEDLLDPEVSYTANILWLRTALDF